MPLWNSPLEEGGPVAGAIDLNQCIIRGDGYHLKFQQAIREAVMMKQLLLIGAASLMLASLIPDTASAQRGMRVGGPVGIGGGAVRGVGIGGGPIRTAAIGGVGIGRPGLGVVGRPGIGAGIGPGVGWRPGLGVGRPGWGVGGWRPGWGVAGWRPGWRGWGWGYPVAAGLLAAGALGYGYGYGYDQCLAWNGYTWVNICYQPYPYSYGYW